MKITTTCSLLALFLVASVLPVQASTISLSVASPVVVGSSFDVLVQANDLFDSRDPDDTLLAFGFNGVVGNGSIVQHVGAEAGPLFDDLSVFGGNPMVAGFATSLLGIGASDFAGPLTLATLHFNALILGTTTIGVISDILDLNQGLVFFDLPYGAINASIDVSTSVSDVPEPATLLLSASAIAMCVIASRRRAPRPRLFW